MASKKKGNASAKPAVLLRPVVISGNALGNLTLTYAEAEHVLPTMQIVRARRTGKRRKPRQGGARVPRY